MTDLNIHSDEGEEWYEDIPTQKIKQFQLTGHAPLSINEVDFEVWWEFRKEAYRNFEGDYGELLEAMWKAYNEGEIKTADAEKLKELEERIEDLEAVTVSNREALKSKSKEDEDNKTTMLDGSQRQLK